MRAGIQEKQHHRQEVRRVSSQKQRASPHAVPLLSAHVSPRREEEEGGAVGEDNEAEAGRERQAAGGRC